MEDGSSFPWQACLLQLSGGTVAGLAVGYAAKAAVRAGLETLLIAYGIRAEDVDAFCIAGGFGCQLDMEKAAGIGLLPEEAVGKADPAGNTSLAGALRWLREEKGGETADRLAGYVREVPLSANKDFQRFYMEYMYFGEDEE